jgi:hypothetical protein
VARGDAAYAAELAPLRTAIELDRFGLVAHVLGDREGCTEEHCDALSRFRDSTREQSMVKANHIGLPKARHPATAKLVDSIRYGSGIS